MVYHLPFKSYGKCTSFGRQTNGQTDMPNTICLKSFDDAAE